MYLTAVLEAVGSLSPPPSYIGGGYTLSPGFVGRGYLITWFSLVDAIHRVFGSALFVFMVRVSWGYSIIMLPPPSCQNLYGHFNIKFVDLWVYQVRMKVAKS